MAASEITSVNFTNMFHFVCFDDEDELTQTLRKIDYIIYSNKERDPSLTHHVFITGKTPLKLSYDVAMTTSATLNDLYRAIRSSSGNIIMNIFGHGNPISKSIVNPAKRSEDIHPSTLTTIGTDYPDKYFVYVFCSCHANPIFTEMEPTNIFAIVPIQCGIVDNVNCLPKHLEIISNSMIDEEYACYFKNKDVKDGNTILILNVKYKGYELEKSNDDEYEYDVDEDEDEDEYNGGAKIKRKSKRTRKTRKSKRTRTTKKSKRTKKYKRTKKSKRTKKNLSE